MKKYVFDMDGTLAKFLFGTPFENLYRERYFLDLPPQMAVVNAAKQLDAYILSAYLPDSKYALSEKKSWNRKWIPEIPEEKQIFIPCGESKGDHYIPDGILIDDRSLHCKEWEAAGGTYVKVAKDEEDWRNELARHRYVIHPDMSTTQILNILRSI